LSPTKGSGRLFAIRSRTLDSEPVVLEFSLGDISVGRTSFIFQGFSDVLSECELRVRLTTGPGAWGAWIDVHAAGPTNFHNHSFPGLAELTEYDVQVRLTGAGAVEIWPGGAVGGKVWKIVTGDVVDAGEFLGEFPV